LGYRVPLDTWVCLRPQQAKCFLSRGTWSDYSRMRSCVIWGFERWSSHVSLPVCFWLSVRVVRYCNHLAQPCEVFHSWDGKTGGVLIKWSRDAWSESGDASEIVTSIGVGKDDRSRDIWPESYLPTGVGHATKVAHMTGVVIYLHYKHA
jgi:hypothetical protein